MRAKRIAVGLLSLVLIIILFWSIFTGVGDVRLQIILAVGIILGLLYTTLGRLPSWMIALSGGYITADDDPSNISPRVYLPILIGVMLVAFLTVVIVLIVG